MTLPFRRTPVDKGEGMGETEAPIRARQQP